MRDYPETVATGVHRATIELELDSGARISLEIRAGESLIRVFENLTDIVGWGGEPVRSTGDGKRLRVEVEGSMAKCKITGLGALRPT